MSEELYECTCSAWRYDPDSYYNPVYAFYTTVMGIWDAFPWIIQALIAMVVGTFVILGIMKMIKG